MIDLKLNRIRPLLVSDMEFNQNAMPPDRSPSRLRFLGDMHLAFHLKDAIFRSNPEWSAGQISQKYNQVCATRHLAHMLVELNWDITVRWALSERQRGEAFEHIIGAFIYVTQNETHVTQEDLTEAEDFLSHLALLLIEEWDQNSGKSRGKNPSKDSGVLPASPQKWDFATQKQQL